ncbi:MAG: hypothetical protein ABWY71_03005 [Candidatus Saccharimonadales bacterium]
MKRVIILHGTLGSPSGNWFTWLKLELERRGLEVWLPQLPRPQQPSLQQEAGFNLERSPNYRAFSKLIELMEQKNFLMPAAVANN